MYSSSDYSEEDYDSDFICYDSDEEQENRSSLTKRKSKKPARNNKSAPRSRAQCKQRTRKRMPEAAKAVLVKWCNMNDNRHPNKEERKALAEETKVEPNKLNKWFHDYQRNRKRDGRRKEGIPEHVRVSLTEWYHKIGEKIPTASEKKDLADQAKTDLPCVERFFADLQPQRKQSTTNKGSKRKLTETDSHQPSKVSKTNSKGNAAIAAPAEYGQLEETKNKIEATSVADLNEHVDKCGGVRATKIEASTLVHDHDEDLQIYKHLCEQLTAKVEKLQNKIITLKNNYAALKEETATTIDCLRQEMGAQKEENIFKGEPNREIDSLRKDVAALTQENTKLTEQLSKERKTIEAQDALLKLFRP